MKQHSFEKFINQEKNSKKKEAIRQEKRKWKEEKKKKYETENQKPGTTTQKFRIHRTQNPKLRTQNPELKTQNSKLKTQNPELGTQNLSEMPLNKFVAHAGICGRREAADIVKEGRIKVNNNVIYEPGFKVTANDKVVFNNKVLHLQKNLIYILLNKPKDYITTVKDEHGRKTVFELIKHATQERVYSVGRLDRNTTGVLLLTNDGELTQKLTHPSFEVKKVYEVKLDKPLHKKDMDAIINGINLEDGFIAADALSYVDSKDRSLIGIEIHSGRNRIVRRIFEHLGYDVKQLDRVLFANLTKKNLERGKWRHLNEKEVRLLKYMNQSFVKKMPEQQPVKRH
jgi:23S rRNA pseudouridine2605 synthase